MVPPKQLSGWIAMGQRAQRPIKILSKRNERAPPWTACRRCAPSWQPPAGARSSAGATLIKAYQRWMNACSSPELLTYFTLSHATFDGHSCIHTALLV